MRGQNAKKHEDSHETLRLNIYQKNHAARRFYEGQGFVVTGESACELTGCAELSLEWPVITEQKDPPPDAEEWDGKEGKLELLER